MSLWTNFMDDKLEPLISLNEAVAGGVERLRMPHWKDPRDHVRIDIVDGRLGPMFHLHSPLNEAMDLENPATLPWTAMRVDPDRKLYVPWDERADMA
jgi:hypothetical protein